MLFLSPLGIETPNFTSQYYIEIKCTLSLLKPTSCSNPIFFISIAFLGVNEMCFNNYISDALNFNRPKVCCQKLRKYIRKLFRRIIFSEILFAESLCS